MWWCLCTLPAAAVERGIFLHCLQETSNACYCHCMCSAELPVVWLSLSFLVFLVVTLLSLYVYSVVQNCLLVVWLSLSFIDCVIIPVLPCLSQLSHVTVTVCVVQDCLLVVRLSLSFLIFLVVTSYCHCACSAELPVVWLSLSFIDWVIIPVLPHLSCCHPFCFTQYYVTNVLVLPQHKRVSCARWQPFLQDRWLSHHNSPTPDVSWFFFKLIAVRVFYCNQSLKIKIKLTQTWGACGRTSSTFCNNVQVVYTERRFSIWK